VWSPIPTITTLATTKPPIVPITALIAVCPAPTAFERSPTSVASDPEGVTGVREAGDQHRQSQPGAGARGVAQPSR
jgi:hypothetical protein